MRCEKCSGNHSTGQHIDCFPIQFRGLEACEKCELNNTKLCYSQDIKKQLIEKKVLK